MRMGEPCRVACARKILKMSKKPEGNHQHHLAGVVVGHRFPGNAARLAQEWLTSYDVVAGSLSLP